MSDLGKKDNHPLQVANFGGMCISSQEVSWNQINLGPAIPHLPNAQSR